MEMALTEKEKAAVLKEYGNEEAAARAYEIWNPAKKADTLFQKILDFFRSIYRAFFPNAETAFGKVKSGEVWGRKGKLPQAIAPAKKSASLRSIKKEISELYDYALSQESGEKRRVIIGKVDEPNAAKLKSATGLELMDYEHVIDNYSIRHIHNKHGNVIKESLRGQIAITKDDFSLIPEIVNNPDTIKLGREVRGQKRISYIKIVNGTIYYMEEVRTGKKQLMAVTMRKWKAGAPSAPSPREATSPAATSETFPGKENIAISEEKGKPPKARIQSAEETVLERYHQETLAQAGERKSLWRRLWERDPALKESWTEFSQKVYDQVVDRYAPGERAQEKLVKAGIALPAGERFTANLAS